MSASTRFNIVRVLAFVVVLGIISIFKGDTWGDWLFAVTSVLLAFSVSLLCYWNVKNDPARSALGLPLVIRPVLVVISLAAFVFILLGWRKSSMAFDLIWIFAFVLNWALYRSTVEHINATQSEHAASAWYDTTKEELLILKTKTSAPASLKELQSLEEEFRLSNKLANSKTEDIEQKISLELSYLSKELDDSAALSKRSAHIKQLLAQRNIVISRHINKKNS